MRASLDTARAKAIVHVAKHPPFAFARGRRIPEFAGKSTAVEKRPRRMFRHPSNDPGTGALDTQPRSLTTEEVVVLRRSLARGSLLGLAALLLLPGAADGAGRSTHLAGRRRAEPHVGARGDRARDVHAGGLRLPGDRLLPREERRHRDREDPRQLLDRLDRVVGRRLRARLRRRGQDHRRLGVLLLDRRHASTAVSVEGEINGATTAFMVFQFMFCAVSLAIVWGTTLERIKFAAYVIYAIVFAARDLPARRALDLRRRLPVGDRRRRAGLRRLDRGPPHRRDRRARGAAAARPAPRASTARTASRGRSRGTRCRSSASAS